MTTQSDNTTFELLQLVRNKELEKEQRERVARGERRFFEFGGPYAVVKAPYIVQETVGHEWYGFLGLQRRSITRDVWKMEIAEDGWPPIEVDCNDWEAL